ncbi:MAG: epoxyqueuosine reductase QueH [Candidatus Omnitrophota bacterium]
MSKQRVLLHACCGPCLIYPLKKLQEEGLAVTIFFYNPNIQPREEYHKRKQTLRDYAAKQGAQALLEFGFDEEVFPHIVGEDTLAPMRCWKCWNMRLQKTADEAKEHGFDMFTSTLFGSPHQDISIMKEIADQVSKETGVGFYFNNFRSGFQEGVRISKELGMYRQNYCGCKFSLEEKNKKSEGR